MRIVGGIYRGKRLKIGRDLEVQPTKNRVREALFDILKDIKEGTFLDLYAGLGTIGLEALSRGAKEVVFVEKREECVKIIEKNLNELGIKRKAKIYCLPAEEALTILSKNGKKFKFIFLDPPYAIILEKLKEILEMIGRHQFLIHGGTLILEHQRAKNIPRIIAPFYLYKQKEYGKSVLSFYKKSAD
ncbi:MAG: 16S rRNA (guanine(966)-N(2))-methyltransferase RsmD [bacterium (Candidatus Ratteibacteria) CG_4_10_14_3_um_filter_41_18]|uniref:16S rRNA (Guanine(966)-N(2))-methyltransferase RsmD n=4 Tax=Candidatus Ratteibacteria TaxID=2979319 RepID=A0A2M7E6W4_9BACT|nr:MAG: 16S rRNA (guanine(966)-N(2))-methyltransferase RsmD [bacterium (Candidatus Ratteibacteria) CG01_land_8_20_14_3_00_40_19]PIW33262.1 MAG: 16S rRNA (guanine(966)-N(2))-methyltransferase RsmD [bacterium (Candidatus Ratteibacteria) CG15_BIG_FIL_POST_REV_8_21_14_020_41_12]PIW74315.1 MAG: 16S rRNA (guanine(966)-N(2))-methyltransferase RsmD [bacterium (Candidatus Ratteibacteria) CG_4_8_14_3_um_filter_41_36]PIX76936.1 MAG: 16S rRNA (guanine(966)-N(2))-methyltransferase RsmD [bacterium (Candidatus